MYESFYRLRNDPFRLLPDPRVCFAHNSCAKAWAYLHYALKRGEGIVVVTGPSGSGKTTLAERLLTGLNPAKVVSVRLIANDLNPTDLLRKLGYSLGLPVEGLDRAMLSHRIERYLIELEHLQRRALVLIDEAQTLSHQSLESMRLLTDMQSRSRPVFQLVLLGQEGLEDVMSAPGMEQLQQRVMASCRLQAMTLEETKAYIEYRLEAADWTGDPSVNGPGVKAIYDYSHGLPRHVNKICSRLLLHGSTEEKHALNERDVTAVVRDLRDELLAPLHDEMDGATEGSQGIFDPVHSLALTPSPRAQVGKDPSALTPRPEPCLADARSVDEAPMPPAADSQSLTRPLASGRAASLASWRRQAPPSTTGERGKYARYRAALSRWPRPVMAGLGIAAAGAVAILSWQSNGPTATASKPRMGPEATSVEGRRYVLSKDQGHLALPYGSVLDLGIPVQDALADPSIGGQNSLHFAQAAAVVAQDEIWDSVAEMRRPRGGLDSVAQRPANLEDSASVAAATAEPDAFVEQRLSPDPGESGGARTAAAEIRRPDAEGALQLADSKQDLADISAERSASIIPDEQYTRPHLGPVPPSAPVASAAAVDPGSETVEMAVSAPPPPQPGLEEQPLLVDAASLLLAATLDNDAGHDAQRGPPIAAAPPEVFDESASAHAAEVTELLALADEALAENRLLFPEQRSAFSYLQQVLEMQPENRDAQARVSRIALRYVELARAALRDAAYDRAVLYLERGWRIAPDDPALRAVDGEISQALAAAEAAKAAKAAEAAEAAAERQRMIAASRARAKVEPEEPKLSSLEMLLRDVNGL